VSRRPTAAAAASLLLGVALAGCGAGQQAQVYAQRSTADGTNAQVGALSVRNLLIRAPKTGRILPRGGEAQAEVTVVNNSNRPDLLTMASSPDAASVALMHGAKPVQSMPVPSLGLVGAGYTIALHGLTRDLHPGEYVQLTLAFADNGHTDLLVPVQSPTDMSSQSIKAPVRSQPAA
jgi:copper(I)-binding protein